MSGEQNDLFFCPDFLDSLRQFDAGNAWHVEVGEDDVSAGKFGVLERVLSARRVTNNDDVFQSTQKSDDELA